MGSPARSSGGRLEFIEATRGVAALLVLVLHTIETYVPEWTSGTHRYFDPGMCGVVAFFFVSGFVIPMTLERTGSQVRFWTNRIFRIYPLYLTIFAAAVIAGFAHVVPYDGGTVHLPKMLVLHLPILQSFTSTQDMVPGSWTLFIELVFYASFSVAFAFALNKRPMLLLVLAAAVVIAVTGAGVAMHKRIPLGRPVLLLDAYCGFVFFRYWQGKVSGRDVAISSGLTLAVGAFAYWENFGMIPYRDVVLSGPLVSMAIAFLIFAGAYAARGAFTGVLKRPSLFVGALTYSTYLLHPLVIALLVHQFGVARWGIVAVPALTIPLAMLTYRLVERPGIEVGRRVGKRLASASAPAVEQA